MFPLWFLRFNPSLKAKLMVWIIYILWQQKETSLAHNIIKKTNLVQKIKGGCSPCSTFGKENTFLLMLDCVKRDFANNKPKCLNILKKSNCESWTIILQKNIRGRDGC
jgi:hypothetical protein